MGSLRTRRNLPGLKSLDKAIPFPVKHAFTDTEGVTMKRITVMTGLLACCLFFVNSYGQEGQQGGSDRTAGRDGRERPGQRTPRRGWAR